ncbi:uncharacterized protein TNCV_1417431 [Trichonephila clavipes]|nr:uncharacterized protein TNCV_1417431 [Trichonephila clavipes]
MTRTTPELAPPLLTGTPHQQEDVSALGRFNVYRFPTWRIFSGVNPGEGMDVCQCIEPSQHGCTLNSRRAASPLVRLVEREKRWEVPDYSQGVLRQSWGETEQNCTVTCMVLKDTGNDRRKNLAHSRD